MVERVDSLFRKGIYDRNTKIKLDGDEHNCY